ncbi:MAG: hypothetical protein JWR19_1133 [Pedosphaera sp.]|nr:hypothetical protein [Pedosphaera sp.]
MTAFEAGAFIGAIGGTVAGAVLCHSHGMLAEVGGAVGGGVIGLFVGYFATFPTFLLFALLYAIARIYWELLTGRRKLPGLSSTTQSQRRRMILLITAILIISAAIWIGLYFTGSAALRARVPRFAALSLGLSFTGLFILLAMYRRHPARNVTDKNEPPGFNPPA